MKKFFTLISVVLMAISANAQELPEHVYPIKDITWGDITWKNGNNKKDKDNKDMFFLMGTGNGYKNIYAEEIYTDGKATGKYRPYYTYIRYEENETGLPGYGLYYKFTPSAAGTIKMCVWVNKGDRKTFIVKGSTGVPMVPYVDYTFEGYVNGQNANTDQPKIDSETGEQAKDNEGNPVWIQAPIFFTADEIKARHDEQGANDYVIEKGNQAVWGWLTFNVEAGESYVVYQQSSQLGFGGFEFGGQQYIASPEGGLAAEFAAVVDAEGKATNVDERGSVVTFTFAGVSVEAVGGAVPTEVTPVLTDPEPDGISVVKTNSVNAPTYNLAGQKVSNDFKGIVVKDGKKFVNK